MLDYDGDTNTAELTRSYYHLNALGSVMEITDANQAAAVSYRYTPYGEVTITRGGVSQGTDPLGQYWGFTGRFSDEESGLWYYRARYFDGTTGRFLQRDPLGCAHAPNLFAYASNSPLSRVDPSGLQDTPPEAPPQAPPKPERPPVEPEPETQEPEPEADTGSIFYTLLVKAPLAALLLLSGDSEPRRDPVCPPVKWCYCSYRIVEIDATNGLPPVETTLHRRRPYVIGACADVNGDALCQAACEADARSDADRHNNARHSESVPEWIRKKREKELISYEARSIVGKCK